MQILLIGGSGFVGHAIAEHFLQRGDRVISLTRGNKPNPPGTVSLVADRKNAAAFQAAIGSQRFDLAVDLTAFSAADVEAVAPTLAGRAGHYVLISTDFAYANDIEAFPINESASTETQLAYGMGKVAAESAMSAAWANLKLPGTALRPPHIMGAGKELGSGSLQGRDRNLLRSMRAGNELTLVGEGELIIQPVWHRQIAETIAACFNKPATFGQVFNCPGGATVTTRRYYQLIADRLGVPLKYDSISVSDYRKQYPDRVAFARHRIYDNAKLTAATGYVPQDRLVQAIDETVGWMESNC